MRLLKSHYWHLGQRRRRSVQVFCKGNLGESHAIADHQDDIDRFGFRFLR